jgi:hypothetical protein
MTSVIVRARGADGNGRMSVFRLASTFDAGRQERDNGEPAVVGAWRGQVRHHPTGFRAAR